MKRTQTVLATESNIMRNTEKDSIRKIGLNTSTALGESN
jgi:hypothetical protein